MFNRGMLLLLVVLMVPTAHGAVYTVGHTSGYNYKTITNAMAAASAGDQIRVVQGVYSADNPEYPETFPIVLKPGVTLVRNSSDILPIIDANQTAQVFICENAPASMTTWIEGFRITGGLLPEGSSNFGGGIYLNHAVITINECEITENRADVRGGGVGIVGDSDVRMLSCEITANISPIGGGGIYVANSNLEAQDCSFKQNSAANDGGAIHCRYSNVDFYRCFIDDNTSNGVAGAVYLGPADSSDSINFEHCNIYLNIASGNGAGVYLANGIESTPTFFMCTIATNKSYGNGGGLYAENVNFLIAFSRFTHNEATMFGGGSYCSDSNGAFVCCKFDDSHATTGAACYSDASTVEWLNCLFHDNEAGEFGGGVYGIGSILSIINATFTLNNAVDEAGAVAVNTSDLSMRNSILWQNTISEIHSYESTVDVRFCDVQGGYTGSSNIDQDPQFISGLNGSHYLSNVQAGQSQNSPCIDAGNRESYLIFYMHEGNSWFLSDSSTRTDRENDIGTADMGYHYYQDPDECCGTGCEVIMPANDFGPGDPCYVSIMVCNETYETYPDIPVFLLLEIAGTFLFAPDFDDFAYYLRDIHRGMQIIRAIPDFTWPPGAGSYSGAVWHSAMTNPEMTALFGEYSSFTFDWHP